MSEGLYPKWGSNQVTSYKKRFSRIMMKTGVVFIVNIVLLVTIGIFIKCGSDNQSLTDEERIKVNNTTDSLINTLTSSNKTIKINTIQANFIRKKVDLFKILINSGKSVNEIKNEESQLTKSFLNEHDNLLTNWDGEIIWIDMFKEKDLDIAITIKPREIIGQKTITKNGQNHTFDCGITIEVDQMPSKKYGYKGIVRSGKLYNKVKNLQEGNKVIFSAIVIDATDDTEATGLNLLTTFHIQLTDIKKK